LPAGFDVAVAVCLPRPGSHFGHEKNAADASEICRDAKRDLARWHPSFAEMPLSRNLAKSREISPNLASWWISGLQPSENRLFTPQRAVPSLVAQAAVAGSGLGQNDFERRSSNLAATDMNATHVMFQVKVRIPGSKITLARRTPIVTVLIAREPPRVVYFFFAPEQFEHL